jgi:polysaccharide export outer membrane protein
MESDRALRSRSSRRSSRSVFAAIAAASALACSHGAPPPPDDGPMDRADYVIGPADVIRVQVWRQPELSTDVPVRPDGKISVPLANDVQAAGLTAEELREVITKALTDYVTAPDVTVMVREIRSKNVQVIGEVLRPAAVPLLSDLRVLDVIALAGGFSPYADKSDIRVLRRNPDGSVIEYRFNYNAFLRGKNTEGNMRLHPGDAIVVPD